MGIMSLVGIEHAEVEGLVGMRNKATGIMLVLSANHTANGAR